MKKKFLGVLVAVMLLLALFLFAVPAMSPDVDVGAAGGSVLAATAQPLPAPTLAPVSTVTGLQNITESEIGMTLTHTNEVTAQENPIKIVYSASLVTSPLCLAKSVGGAVTKFI